MSLLLKSIFIFLFSLSFVFAFGPSSPYWKDRPIYLNTGESLTFDITLQNLVGGEDVTLKASTNNNEIVILPEGNPKEYIIPFGRDDIKVPVKISVPKSANIGERFDIAISFKQVPKAGAGNVGLVSETLISFPVIVQKEEPKLQPESGVGESRGWKSIGLFVLLSFVVLLSLFLVIYLIVRYRKNV